MQFNEPAVGLPATTPLVNVEVGHDVVLSQLSNRGNAGTNRANIRLVVNNNSDLILQLPNNNFEYTTTSGMTDPGMSYDNDLITFIVDGNLVITPTRGGKCAHAHD